VAVYIACREERHPLYMKDVYYHLGVPAKYFGGCFKRIMDDLALRLPSMGPKDYLTIATGYLFGNTQIKVTH
jgi:transcription initiation factor TFIIIB Brf1 subunit/transcription initiation factor TFIIB